MHIDTHAAAVEAWHLAATGSPWLEGDLSDQMRENIFITKVGNGHVVGARMAGPVVAAIPFYLALNNERDPDRFSFVPAALCAASLSALTLLLMFAALRSELSVWCAALAALVLGFATPMWTISANMLWTHTITQLGIAGSAYACSRQRYWLAGAFLGLGMLGRPHVALVAAVLGLGLGWKARRVQPTIALAGPTMAALAGLVLWNRWMFGEWSIGGAYEGRAVAAVEGFQGSTEWDGAYPQLTNILGFLVSPDRGLLVWTPVVGLLLPAVWRSRRQLPIWSILLAAGGIIYSFFQLRVNYFPGGDQFYGYRHALELTTCLTPALAFSLSRAGRVAKAALPWLVAVQFSAILVGALLDAYYVPLQDVWRDNSYWVAARTRPEMVGAALLVPLLSTALAVVVQRRRPGVREAEQEGSLEPAR